MSITEMVHAYMKDSGYTAKKLKLSDLNVKEEFDHD